MSRIPPVVEQETELLSGKVIVYVMASSRTFVRHHLQLAKAAAANNHVVAVLARDDAASEAELAACGIDVRWLSMSRRTGNPLTVLDEVRSLRQLLEQLQPDVVNAVNLKSVLLAALAGSGRQWLFVGTITGLGYMFSGNSVRQRLLRKATIQGLAWALRRQRHVLVMSNRDDADEFVRRGVTARDRMRIIPVPGIDADEFRISSEPEAGYTVVLPARMLRSKGVVEFVAVAKRLKPVLAGAEFVLAGEPDSGNPDTITKEMLEQWSNSGAVSWIGRCDDMPGLLAGSHVICLPTSYREGFPRTLVEAMACGRAVVTTDVPGCREINEHGCCGMITPVGDEDALAYSLQWLYEHPEERRAMGHRGRGVVKKHFLASTITHAMLACYTAAEMHGADSRDLDA